MLARDSASQSTRSSLWKRWRASWTVMPFIQGCWSSTFTHTVVTVISLCDHMHSSQRLRHPSIHHRSRNLQPAILFWVGVHAPSVFHPPAGQRSRRSNLLQALAGCERPKQGTAKRGPDYTESTTRTILARLALNVYVLTIHTIDGPDIPSDPSMGRIARSPRSPRAYDSSNAASSPIIIPSVERGMPGKAITVSLGLALSVLKTAESLRLLQLLRQWPST